MPDNGMMWQVMVLGRDGGLVDQVRRCAERTFSHVVLHTCADAGLAAALLTREPVDIAVVVDGLRRSGDQSLLQMLQARRPGCAVLLIEEAVDAASALAALRQGAVDLLITPPSDEALCAALLRARNRRNAAGDALSLRLQAEQRSSTRHARTLQRLSHALREPLSTVLGYSQLLLRGRWGELDTSHTKPLRDIRAATSGMVSMLDDLMEISLDPHDREPLRCIDFDAVDLVLTVIAGLAAEAAEREVRIEAADLPESLPVKLDQNACAVVLHEVMRNAVRFVAKGGHVRVWAGLLPDHQLQVVVDDDGPGVDAAQRDRVFEPFERLDRAAGDGHGLGLSLARALVRQMDGDIALGDSSLGGLRVAMTFAPGPHAMNT